MLNLACQFGVWLGTKTITHPRLLPVFLADVYAFAVTAWLVNRVTR